MAQAKKIYGEDKENLNEIITKTLNLQTKLDEGIKDVTSKEERLERLLEEQKELKEKNEIRLNATIARLEKEYYEAINAAKAVINFKDIKDKQRALNVANEKKAAIIKPKKTEREILKVGDRVKYENIKGTVLSISKNDAMIESNGINLRVPLELLRKNGNEVVLPKKGGVSLSVDKPKTASLSIDLHGMRADEAIAKLDKFISDSLVMGFDEVSVFHGIGTGKLAFAVKNFLKEHPSVKEFFDAPANQGGYGAKIVRL